VFLDRRVPHRTPGSSAANPLYAAWVEEARIEAMLEANDLKDGPLMSLLDSTVLDSIVDARLRDRSLLDPHRPVARAWLPEDRLPVLLTLTNLRGIPYGIRFAGTPFAHFMRQHADFVRFALALSAGALPRVGETLINDDFFKDDANRRAFRAAVLGTGAFPVGLRARIVAQRREDLELRAGLHASSPLANGSKAGGTGLQELRPDWPNANENPIQSLCVDGGALDNEPLELVRRELAGWKGQNPRAGNAANRAVVLVDPFVNPSGAETGTDIGLLAQLPALIGSLIGQARFKPEELALAADGDVYSRFILAPSRGPRWKGEGAIAGGYLGGFMGFLHRDYRHHDFMLGRRNARSFLRNHFLLPADNKLFQGWQKSAKEMARWGRRRPGSEVWYLPIIPLCGRLLPGGTPEADEDAIEPLPPWPSHSLPDAALRDLEQRIAARAEAVVKAAWRERASGLKPKLREKAEDWVEAQGWFLRQTGRLVNAFRGRHIADAIERQAIARLAEAATSVAMERIKSEVSKIAKLGT
jgi:hypothetical protein